jgi:hypothetical protein
MKKQYRIEEKNWHTDYFLIYKNGELTETKIVDRLNFEEELEKLENNGYKYGYSKDEVELAKLDYEYKLKRIIKEEVDLDLNS